MWRLRITFVRSVRWPPAPLALRWGSSPARSRWRWYRWWRCWEILPLTGNTEFLDLLAITIPSTLLGILAIGIFSWFRGKDTDQDEAFRAFIALPENRHYVYGDTATLLDKKLPTSNWIAMWIFLASIAVVALLGAFSELRPAFDGKPLSMVLVIQMFMLLSGALIIIITKTNPASISKNEVFRSGMIAIVAVYGIAWMAETMFGAHMTEIKGVLGEMVKEYPWAYAIVLLLVSKFVNSRAAALAAIVPVAPPSASTRPISWLLRRPAMATIFCRPTQAIWRRSSLIAQGPPISAAL